MLAFLHTADVHVETFEELARQCDEPVPTQHEVRPDLLAMAREVGATSDAVSSAVREVLHRLASNGAKVILCTCSTIGGLAEAAAVPGCTVLRVDRPVVERALASGRRILLVAALPTALQQTLTLLRQMALENHCSPEVVEVLCEQAWPLFEQGDTSSFFAEIVETVGSVAVSGDLVLLAQASMAQIEPLITRADIVVLSSPKPSVEAALAAYRGGVATAQNLD